MRWPARALLAACTATCGHAWAGGTDLDDASPRSIGRAGATVVSDDGEGALLLSPASLARRSETRVRIGFAFRERDISFDALGGDFVTIRDSAGPTVSPSLVVASELGPLVVAASYIEPTAGAGLLPSPAFGQPAADIIRLFPHRYSGDAYSQRARELRLGGAIRVTDWLAAGVAASARRVELAETRTLWAGFSGRDGLANPLLDVELRLDGADDLALGGTAGLLFAPLDLPIEMAAAFSYMMGARIDAEALVVATQPGGPGGGGDLGAGVLALPDQMTASGGIRYVQGRVAGEVGAILRLVEDTDSAPTWQISGVELLDSSGLTADVDDVPSQWTPKRHLSVLGSVDVEILDGFLWLTSGYRYQQAATPARLLAPATADLGGHTIAFGAEVYVRGITATIGYSRSFVDDVWLRDGDAVIVNPFDGGSAATGLGSYDRTDDRVGLSIELSLASDDDLAALPP